MLQIAIVQHGDHANIDVREWNLDIIRSAPKNDQISATEHASTRCPDEEALQSEDKKKKRKKTREEEDLQCVADEETEEGSKQSSNCDQDSDISFHEDTDEEIDKGEMEEEDWVEYIKRSPKEAEEHMMKTKIPCWTEPRESHRSPRSAGQVK